MGLFNFLKKERREKTAVENELADKNGQQSVSQESLEGENQQRGYLTVEKKQIADGELAISYGFDVVTGDGNKYKFGATKFKRGDLISYSLYQAKDDKELELCMREIADYMRREYQITLFTVPIAQDYYDAFDVTEKRNRHSCFFKIGDCALEFHFFYESHYISFINKGDHTHEAMSDNLAACLVCCLHEAVAKNTTGLPQ